MNGKWRDVRENLTLVRTMDHARISGSLSAVSHLARSVGGTLTDPPLEFETVMSAGAVATFFRLPDQTPFDNVIVPTKPLESIAKLSVLLGILVVASTFTTCEIVSYSATVMVSGGSLLTVIGAVRVTPL